MLRKALLIGVLALAGTQTAFATSWLSCSNEDAALELRLLLGGDETMGPVAATIALDSLRFTTDPAYGEGTPITIAQSYFGPTLTQVDLRDGAVDQMVAQLRLVSDEEGGMFARAGTLRLHGHGAWPVICAEGE